MGEKNYDGEDDKGIEYEEIPYILWRRTFNGNNDDSYID